VLQQLSRHRPQRQQHVAMMTTIPDDWTHGGYSNPYHRHATARSQRALCNV